MVGTYTPAPDVPPEDVWPPPVEPIAARQTTWQRFIHKFKEEPLVPIGIAATVVALGGATSALQKGNRTQFNKWLRYRVAAQGLTVIAALGGSVYYARERRAVRDAEKSLREADKAAKLAALPVDSVP